MHSTDCHHTNYLQDTLKWLYEMIESPMWRQAIYELAELPQNDACPFLSMTMTCMAFNDKYLGELSSVPKSWSEMSTLMRCVSYLLEPLLSMPKETAKIDRDSFLRMKEQIKRRPNFNNQEYRNKFQTVLYENLNGFLVRDRIGCFVTMSTCAMRLC